MSKKADTYPRHVAAVRLEAALRVRPYISSDATRYYLNGAYIEPAAGGGAVCVATDGHRLGVRRDQNGLCIEPVIVSLPKILKLDKKPKWLVVTLTERGKGFLSIIPVEIDDSPEAAMERTDQAEMRLGHVVIDGTFPDWRHIVPVPQKTDPQRGFNAKYFASFGDSVSIQGGDNSAPHLVSDTRDPDFIGVLMPLRADAPKMPSWIGLPDRKQAA